MSGTSGKLAVALTAAVLAVAGCSGSDTADAAVDAACSTVNQMLQTAHDDLAAMSDADTSSNDVVDQYLAQQRREDINTAARKKFAASAAGLWPNVDDEDLKSTLKQIAAETLTDDQLNNAVASLKAICQTA